MDIPIVLSLLTLLRQSRGHDCWTPEKLAEHQAHARAKLRLHAYSEHRNHCHNNHQVSEHRFSCKFQNITIQTNNNIWHGARVEAKLTSNRKGQVG
jgi:hypothetical protein